MGEPYDAKLDLWSVGCIFKEMLEAAGVADTRKKVGFAARKVTVTPTVTPTVTLTATPAATLAVTVAVTLAQEGRLRRAQGAPLAPRELFRSVAVTCPLRVRYITAT